tara:strand:+ start:104 stop:790 length:687 start_codon:yes stop_codon:yes gene_type:complete
MCTVTYLPLDNSNFLLTSNRDETPLRKTLPPEVYIENGVEVTYPKDEVAGGTWIGKSKKNRVVCLLNGGFVKHKRNLPYAMSRGLIVKNILGANDAVAYINRLGLNNIEPFTIVIVDWNQSLKTFELVWDGVKKHFTELPQEPKIWSSSTLYTEDMKQLRKNWFANWLQENDVYTKENILAFHKNDSLGTPEVTPKMKRNLVETVSITLIEKKEKTITMSYIDFLEDK